MKARYVEYGGKLALVCVVCMLGVAGAFVMAMDRIAEGKQKAFKSAIREVLGLSAEAPDPEALNPDAPPEEQVFKAEVDGSMRYATQGAHQGFSGGVVVAVGARFEEDRLLISEVRVISQTETPGLGTRIAEQETNLTLWSKIAGALGSEMTEETDWFFLKRYRDKGTKNLVLTADPAEADERILKITGVTISTNACTAACRKALASILEMRERLR